MVISRSFLANFGVIKGSAWGTAVDANVAGKGLRFLNEAISASSNLLEDESITGTADQGVGQTGSKTITGSVQANLQYSNPVLSTLIAMAMGRADTPVTPLGTDGSKPYAYYGSYRLGDILETYFVTMALDKQTGSVIHEYDSVKINGMTIAGSAGAFVTITFDIIGRKLTTSGTTTTSLAAATVALPRKEIRFEDFKFRINQLTDSALAQGDAVYPTSFSVTLANNLEGDLTSQNAPYVDEPIRNAARNVSGSFEIPKYTDENIETRFLDGTVMKMQIVARSNTQIPAAGGGPYYYQFAMYMPSVQITNAPRPVSGFAKVPANFEWVAKEVTNTAPDGMDGNGDLSTLTNEESRGSITESIRIEVTNTQQSNPLA